MSEYHIDDMMLDIQMRVPLSDIKQKIRAEAIDEFVKALEEHQQKNWIDNLEYGITFADIEDVAEQLKEKKNG